MFESRAIAAEGTFERFLAAMTSRMRLQDGVVRSPEVTELAFQLFPFPSSTTTSRVGACYSRRTIG